MANVVRVSTELAEFGASPRTLSMGGAVGSGNSVIFVTNTDSYDVAGVDFVLTDNQGNTYVVDFDTTENDGTTQKVVLRCHNITNAPTEFSISWTGGGDRYIAGYFAELSGVANAAPSDTDKTNQPFGASVSASLTSTGASALGLAFFEGGSDITPQSGFTRSPGSGSSNFIWMYDEDLGAAGAKTFGATWTGDGNRDLYSLIYENAGAGVTGSGSADLPGIEASGSGTVGPASVTLVAPLATAGLRLRTMPDLAPGDIVEYEVYAGAGSITVNTNGSFFADAGVTHFRYRVNDGGGFGDWIVDEVRPSVVRPATIARLPGFSASGTGTVS